LEIFVDHEKCLLVEYITRDLEGFPIFTYRLKMVEP
jgi:hypothetical protein